MILIKKKLKPRIIKIASGEINNIFLLRKINIKQEKVIISTGMTNYKDIVNTLNYLINAEVYKIKKNKVKIINKKLFRFLSKNIFLMHCVTDYPVRDKFANLSCIANMIKDFKLSIGYSDHTEGTLAPVIAVSQGATIIEKHITLNNKAKGPDHKSSLEPRKFTEMVNQIRKCEIMLGKGIKKLQKCEINNKFSAKKSLVAKILIKKNDKFNFKNVTVKRPAAGSDPFLFKKILHKKSKKQYLPNEMIKI